LDAIRRWLAELRQPTDVRRAAILGAGFGLLMVVVVILACVVINFMISLR
jgi:hypothetical protein